MWNFFSFFFCSFSLCLYLSSYRLENFDFLNLSVWRFLAFTRFANQSILRQKCCQQPQYTTLLTQIGSLVAVRYHDWMIISMLCFPFFLSPLPSTLSTSLSLVPLEWIQMKSYATDKRIVAANKLPFSFLFFSSLFYWFEPFLDLPAALFCFHLQFFGTEPLLRTHGFIVTMPICSIRHELWRLLLFKLLKSKSIDSGMALRFHFKHKCECKFAKRLILLAQHTERIVQTDTIKIEIYFILSPS